VKSAVERRLAIFAAARRFDLMNRQEEKAPMRLDCRNVALQATNALAAVNAAPGWAEVLTHVDVADASDSACNQLARQYDDNSVVNIA
jgi:hypothetical protein